MSAVIANRPDGIPPDALITALTVTRDLFMNSSIVIEIDGRTAWVTKVEIDNGVVVLVGEALP